MSKKMQKLFIFALVGFLVGMTFFTSAMDTHATNVRHATYYSRIYKKKYSNLGAFDLFIVHHKYYWVDGNICGGPRHVSKKKWHKMFKEMKHNKMMKGKIIKWKTR